MNDDRSRFEAKLVVLEQNRLVRYGARAALVAGFALFVAAVLFGFGPGVLGAHLALVGGVLALRQARHNVVASRRERIVRTAPDCLEIEGAGALPRSRVADGLFQPRSAEAGLFGRRAPGSSVRLLDRRRHVVFEAETTEGQALELLRALGLDAGSKRAEFRGASPLFATADTNVALGVAFVGVAFALRFLAGLFEMRLSFAFASFLTMPLLYGAMIGSRIVVGIDGILVRWLWTKRFIPMSEIVSVTPVDTRAVQLGLASGKVHMLYTSNHKRTNDYDRQHRDAVYARVVEAWHAHRARGSAADIASLVAKGGRPQGEWKRALEALKNEDRGYRQGAIRDEDLWRVVEDPRSPEDARAGAAVLLRRSLDDDGKARIRVAADATASPRLRVVFDAASGDSDEKVDEALAELASEQGPGSQAAARSLRRI